MEKTHVTPKDFFLWSGGMIALYVSVFSLITLFFQYIDFAFPDSLNNYVDPYSGAIRFSIASLLVLFPVFLVVMRFIRKDIIKVPAKKDIWVRRWALYVTVFLAAVTVIIDLITLVNYFLGGDLSTRFFLKVAIVLLIAGAGFLHFLADIWGFWVQYPDRARAVGYGAGLVVVATIASGFLIMGTPSQMRQYRFDDQRVSDLQNIQSQVINYWQLKQQLPKTLGELNDPISGNIIPVDPQSTQSYTYSSIASTTFKLCATFGSETQPNSMYSRAAPMPPEFGPGGAANDTWYHGVGQTCYSRTIDPERYPTAAKTKGL